MRRIGESPLEKIIRKTGRKPCSCRCKKCQSQCLTPCLATPHDIRRLIEAGYKDRLEVTVCNYGPIRLYIGQDIRMVQAKMSESGCTFFHDGLCELHDLGLKPTEGRLSHHSITLSEWSPRRSIAINVAKEWLEPENREIIEEVIEKMKDLED